MSVRHVVLLTLLFCWIVASCQWDAGMDISIRHPIQQLAEEAAKQEPTLEKILQDWGYPQDVIENPLDAKAFQPVGDVQLTWIAKHTDKQIQIGWIQDGQEHLLLMTDNIIQIPTPLDVSNRPLGFFIKTLGEESHTFYLDPAQNNGMRHVKIFPQYVDGNRQKNVRLLFWEDEKIPNNKSDYQDIILRISGVKTIQSLHN